ncbi:MAG: diguanylate cyclase [Nitrospiraceae bacterium]
MKLLYSFVVPGGLLVLAALGFLRPRGLPGWMQPIVGVYPYIVLVVGLLFGWHFDRSRMVLAMLTLTLADGALLLFTAGDAATGGVGRIVFNAVAFLLPLNLMALSLMTERGALVRSGMVWLSVTLTQLFLVAWICRPELAEVAASLEFAYVDPRWTEWTPIAQPALLAFVVTLVLQLSRFMVYKNAIESGFMWALVASFIALHGSRFGWSPTNYFATAGLILFLALLEASYKMTYHDELTGVPGRLALDQALPGLGSRYAVAMVDIDHLKDVNDQYGIGVGDQVLQMVATKITSVSGGGKAFRYSGEEFAVLFSGKSAGDTLVHLETLRKTVEASRFALRGRGRLREQTEQLSEDSSTGEELSVTISVGVAERDDRKATPEQVIKAAYKALYRAKLDGGNLVKR